MRNGRARRRAHLRRISRIGTSTKNPYGRLRNESSLRRLTSFAATHSATSWESQPRAGESRCQRLTSSESETARSSAAPATQTCSACCNRSALSRPQRDCPQPSRSHGLRSHLPELLPEANLSQAPAVDDSGYHLARNTRGAADVVKDYRHHRSGHLDPDRHRLHHALADPSRRPRAFGRTNHEPAFVRPLAVARIPRVFQLAG
jgi:hypothetical protein